jgi:hypothetical protein
LRLSIFSVLKVLCGFQGALRLSLLACLSEAKLLYDIKFQWKSQQEYFYFFFSMFTSGETRRAVFEAQDEIILTSKQDCKW